MAGGLSCRQVVADFCQSNCGQSGVGHPFLLCGVGVDVVVCWCGSWFGPLSAEPPPPDPPPLDRPKFRSFFSQRILAPALSLAPQTIPTFSTMIMQLARKRWHLHICCLPAWHIARCAQCFTNLCVDAADSVLQQRSVDNVVTRKARESSASHVQCHSRLVGVVLRWRDAKVPPEPLRKCTTPLFHTHFRTRDPTYQTISAQSTLHDTILMKVPFCI